MYLQNGHYKLEREMKLNSIEEIKPEWSNNALLFNSIISLIVMYDWSYESAQNKPEITPIPEALIKSQKLTCKERFQQFNEFLNNTENSIWKNIAEELKNNKNSSEHTSKEECQQSNESLNQTKDGFFTIIKNKIVEIFTKNKNSSENTDKIDTDKIDIDKLSTMQKDIDYRTCKIEDIKQLLIQEQNPTRLLFELVKNSCEYMDDKMYALLTSNGANPYAANDEGHTLLHLVSRKFKNFEKFDFNDTPFIKICFLNTSVSMDINEESLIKSHQELNYQGIHTVNHKQNNSPSGATALYFACTNKTPDMQWIRTLLDNGADPNSRVAVNQDKPLTILEHIFNQANQYRNGGYAVEIVELFLSHHERTGKLVFDDWVLAKPTNDQQAKIQRMATKTSLVKATQTFLSCTKAGAEKKANEGVGLLAKKITYPSHILKYHCIKKTTDDLRTSKDLRNIIISYFFKNAGPVGESLLRENNQLNVGDHFNQFKPN